MAEPSEEWRRIDAHPDYEVSNLGRVRSWKRHHSSPAPRILRPRVNKGGYRYVDLDGRSRTVHRLVATAFLGPLPLGKVTRHLDGDQSHNGVANLAYGTVSENTLDNVRLGVHPMARKTECKHGHPFTPENTYLKQRPNKTARICRTCHRNRYRVAS